MWEEQLYSLMAMGSWPKRHGQRVRDLKAMNVQNRLGVRCAFLEDPLLTGMLAARAGKGLASKLKREALVEAQKDAKKEIEAGKQVEAVNSSDQEVGCPPCEQTS